VASGWRHAGLILDIVLVAAGWFVRNAHDDEPLLKCRKQIELPEIVPGLQTELGYQLRAGIGGCHILWCPAVFVLLQRDTHPFGKAAAIPCPGSS